MGRGSINIDFHAQRRLDIERPTGETDKAIRFRIQAGVEVWIPKSKISKNKSNKRNPHIYVPLWLLAVISHDNNISIPTVTAFEIETVILWRERKLQKDYAADYGESDYDDWMYDPSDFF